MPLEGRKGWYPALALLACCLSACQTVSYRRIGDSHETRAPFIRAVDYQLTDTYYSDPPDCVTVLPADGAIPGRRASLLEEAVARHLMQKVPRVIGPHERMRIVRASALDLTDPRDRRHYARARTCRFFLETTAGRPGDFYALVWSSKTLAVSGKLVRAQDGALLWQASHTASRQDGGLPISPLSLGFAVFDAGSQELDDEVFPSMVDDAVRRVMATLPDAR